MMLASGQPDGTAGPYAQFQAKEKVTVKYQGPPKQGHVVSTPQGIDCEPACFAEFRQGTEIVLVAGHGKSSSFVRWGGDCVGRSVLCVLVAERDTNVTARFDDAPTQDVGLVVQEKYWLYVTAPGAGGGGTIRSSQGISCPARCRKKVRRGNSVTLRAEPAAGYAPKPLWQSYPPGICRFRAARCTVTMDTTTHIGATFRRTP